MLAYSVYYLTLKSEKVRFSRNVGKYIPGYMASHSNFLNLKCYQQQTYMPFVLMWLLMQTDMLNQLKI
jgi:hypothetical protein